MITLKLLTVKGMICRDDDGNPWTTWSGDTHTCAECGRDTTDGYIQVGARQIDRYVCPEHVCVNISRFVNGVPA